MNKLRVKQQSKNNKILKAASGVKKKKKTSINLNLIIKFENQQGHPGIHSRRTGFIYHIFYREI